jgi:ParB-like chromosome segregation protein Spo0J
MTRSNAEFHGSVNVPISEVNEFIPSDYDDGDHSNPIRMKHVDEESCQNYDTHDDDYVGTLASDIAKRGLRTPIEATKLDDGETLLTEGHHRVMAARKLNMTHIPVIYK